MKRILLAAATAALLMPAVQAQTEVRLAVHKSFSLPKDAFAAFERANDAKVSVIKAGSGNELVNKLVLSRAQPIADAVYGLDNTTVLKAKEGGILAAAHAEFQRNHVQDAYSIRCSPQVTGAVRDTADYATTVANRELAAAIDNPVVTLDGRVVSNGNFHGAPIAYVLDFLAIAVADLASISERRTDRFLDVARNRGLNAFLADDPGVDSGHMIAQYTQAGIVSELKRNATPASVDSIPSSAMQEDHVSMGWSAGRKLRRSIDGLARVLAIEILTAARAIDLRTTDDTNTPAPGTGAVVACLRETVAGPGTDRYLAPEIAEVVALVMDGSLVAAAEHAVGELH